MNTDDVFHSTETPQPLETFGQQLRDTFPIPSALQLHRTSHDSPARLAAEQHGQRTFAESESGDEGIRHREPSPIKAVVGAR